MSSGSGSVKAPSGSRKRCVNVPISDGTVLLNMQCECLSDEDNKQECTCYKPANLMLVPESKAGIILRWRALFCSYYNVFTKLQKRMSRTLLLNQMAKLTP